MVDHHSSAHLPDPVVVLAIREEIDRGNRPIMEKLVSIDSRLSQGDLRMALLEKRMDDSEKIKTDRIAKDKKSLGDRMWLTIAFGAASAAGAALWSGVMTLMHKGNP